MIAEELMVIFSCVGIPKEILTDQGSNFQSGLLAELNQLLHIAPLRTSPYHPQTNGLVESFNKTLKDTCMLKKTAVEEGRDWDKLLHTCCLPTGKFSRNLLVSSCSTVERFVRSKNTIQKQHLPLHLGSSSSVGCRLDFKVCQQHFKEWWISCCMVYMSLQRHT